MEDWLCEDVVALILGKLDSLSRHAYGLTCKAAYVWTKQRPPPLDLLAAVATYAATPALYRWAEGLSKPGPRALARLMHRVLHHRNFALATFLAKKRAARIPAFGKFFYHYNTDIMDWIIRHVHVTVTEDHSAIAKRDRSALWEWLKKHDPLSEDTNVVFPRFYVWEKQDVPELVEATTSTTMFPFPYDCNWAQFFQ